MATINSINIDHSTSAIDVANQKLDALINSNRHARAVLSLLIMAILDDSPPTDELVIDTLEGLNAILTVD